jgi:flagellar motility protein MotE (MotC chaperone)
MYVLSKLYPQLFRPSFNSSAEASDIPDTLAIDSVRKIIWEDTSSIGLEYIELFKYDSLKREYEKVVRELRRYQDSVRVLNRIIETLRAELNRKDLLISSLQRDKDEEAKRRAKSIAKVYESMDPKSAAKILENLSDDEVLEIILNMNRRQAAKILAELNALKAAKITKMNGRKIFKMEMILRISPVTV